MSVARSFSLGSWWAVEWVAKLSPLHKQLGSVTSQLSVGLAEATRGPAIMVAEEACRLLPDLNQWVSSMSRAATRSRALVRSNIPDLTPWL